MKQERVYVCDIGSIAKRRFGWASSTRLSGNDPVDIVAHVCEDLRQNHSVSLGFECPLFVPCPEDSDRLGCARQGENTRSFSASAGACSLVTGLVQICWILRALNTRVSVEVVPTFRVESLDCGSANLLLWEAFVTGPAKQGGHCDDAMSAVDDYLRRRRESESLYDVQADDCFSLIGAALLWSGLAKHDAVLHERCCVLRVKPQ